MVEQYESELQQLYQQMPQETQLAFIEQLKQDYKQIILRYFKTNDSALKQRIEQFIKKLFIHNITVTQVLEIHMELIDEFAKQLQIEGRSDEILLDYRLTLIDILAQLCETYRCYLRK